MAKFNRKKNCIELEPTDLIKPAPSKSLHMPKFSHSELFHRINDIVPMPITVIEAMVEERSKRIANEVDHLIYKAFKKYGYSIEWLWDSDN